MTDTEITTLAREYAEEIAQEVAVKFNPQDWACSHCEIEAQAVIKFLLRRYCLVEKDRVKEVVKSADNLILARDATKQNIGVGMRGAIRSLFPKIGKEVEG